MRTCNSCQTQMTDLILSVALNRWGICVRENDNTKEITENLGQVKCAVCPNCGEISLYLDNLAKLKKHIETAK